MDIESCDKSDNAQKWYFLDKGGGFFQIINVHYRYKLESYGGKYIKVYDENKDDDYQKWSINGQHLRNKAWPNVYLTNSKGDPQASSEPYKWNFESV